MAEIKDEMEEEFQSRCPDVEFHGNPFRYCSCGWTEPPSYRDIQEAMTDHQDIRAKDDPVNHPSHYTQYDGFEVIDITEQLTFNLGNAVKYILRAYHKGNLEQDLSKAMWYLEREQDRQRKQRKKS